MNNSLKKALSLLLASSMILPGTAVWAGVSAAPDAANVSVTNNVGIADLVKVTNGVTGDIVKVYTAAVGGDPVGTAIVGVGKTEATSAVTQLGTTAGSVYVTLTNTGNTESARTKVDYLAESQTTAPLAGTVTVTNNAGIADTVAISGLAANDVIKVYDAATVGKILGTGTGTATVGVGNLVAAGGTVYVTVAALGKSESTRVPVVYTAEPKSTTLSAGAITVNNNAGTSSKVIVTGLVNGDVIRVYDALTSGKLLGQATTVSGTGTATAGIGTLPNATGNVYVSLISSGKSESDRIAAAYAVQTQSVALSAGVITVTNKVGLVDTVTVTGLAQGDVVKVYTAATAGSLMGTGAATTSIGNLPAGSGNVYVSVTSLGKLESDRVAVAYIAEPISDVSDAARNTVIVNNAGAFDTVTVTGLAVNDNIKVYSASSGGVLLGTATVGLGKTSVMINISQIGSDAGSVFMTLTNYGKLESARIQLDVDAELGTTQPGAGTITIINNALLVDTVTVTGVTAGQLVKVYNAETAGNSLGFTTVGAGKTTATVNISQLGKTAGTVYVSLATPNRKESLRTSAAYLAEPVSTAPTTGNITVVNNAVIQDTILVTGLTTGTIVKVYNAATAGTLLGTTTVETGATSTTVRVSQLGAAAGTVYVSISTPGSSESPRTAEAYDAEAVSIAPVSGNITIANNVRATDTVTVTGALPGDVIKIYDAAVAGNKTGGATVEPGKTSIIIPIAQVGQSAGNLYLTTTSVGKLESTRTQVAFAAEPVTSTPVSGMVTVTNSSGLSDVVRVTGLLAGDQVKVYQTPVITTILGGGTVGIGKTEVSISISQLGTAAGSCYVTVTSPNKVESARYKMDYDAEVQSDAPTASKVVAINNTGADMLLAYGLKTGTMVRVYDASTGGKLIGNGIVSEKQSQVLIYFTQLGAPGGTIYVTLASSGKSESTRTAITFIAE